MLLVLVRRQASQKPHEKISRATGRLITLKAVYRQSVTNSSVSYLTAGKMVRIRRAAEFSRPGFSHPKHELSASELDLVSIPPHCNRRVPAPSPTYLDRDRRKSFSKVSPSTVSLGPLPFPSVFYLPLRWPLGTLAPKFAYFPAKRNGVEAGQHREESQGDLGSYRGGPNWRGGVVLHDVEKKRRFCSESWSVRRKRRLQPLRWPLH